MAKKIDTSHVLKLQDGNYQRWKLQVSLVLRAAEVFDVVDGTTPKPAAAGDDLKKWEKKDIEAQAIIVPLLDKKQTGHIYNCTTAHEMWEKLKAINSDSSTLNKQHTLSKFYNYKINGNQSAVEAFVEIEDLSRSLNEMGISRK